MWKRYFHQVEGNLQKHQDNLVSYKILFQNLTLLPRKEIVYRPVHEVLDSSKWLEHSVVENS